jgi:phage N-6-adenine-methyltransferase
VSDNGSPLVQHVRSNGSKDSDQWETPESLFRAYDWEFAFTLDACASSKNHKLPNYESKDGLSRSWANERVWCNPPYSDIEPWVAKAAERESEVTALLLPVRTGTTWWQKYARYADEVRFFRKRVKFAGAEDTPSWETCLMIWRFHP